MATADESITADPAEAAVPDLTDGRQTAGPLIQRHLLAAGAFLVLAAVASTLAAALVVAPGFLGSIGYGRLQPVAIDLLLYGWLTVGFVGAAYHIVTKATGRTLSRPGLATIGLLSMGIGVVLGSGAVLMGITEGRWLVEYPLWADAFIAVGLAIAVATIVQTARGVDSLPAPALFSVAAPVWLLLAFVAGNVPGIGGINSVLQNAFYQASIVGLGIGAAGIGVLYYVIPAATGRPPRPVTQLTLVALWSLAFTWAWTAPRFTQFGPTPDWLETIGVLASIGLLVPVLAIAAETTGAMRGYWHRMADRPALAFALAGTGLFALTIGQGLLLALRSSSAVLQFSDWVAGYDYLALFGAFTMWLAAFGYHLVGGSGRAARAHLGLSLGGVAIAVAATWVAGLQMGFTWASAANTQEFVNAGDGFINSIRPFRGTYVLQAVGLGVFALGQLVFLRHLLGARGHDDGAAEAIEDDDSILVEPTSEHWDDVEARPSLATGALVVRAVGMFVLAAAIVWLLPALDTANRNATLLADSSRDLASASLEAEGRALYISEGCMYCHTQQVRGIVTDVGLGPVSQPGDYVYDVPALLGQRRIGPDLTHVGSREPSDSIRWLLGYLEDPTAERPWSLMPAYDHLSDSDVERLAAYLASLD